MPHTRRHRSAVAKVPPLAGDCIVSQLRFALATFLRNASNASSSHPRFFLLRTNGWKSLSMLTGLLPFEFSTLLLAAGSVFITNSKNGSKLISVSQTEWDDNFLCPHLLCGVSERDGDTSRLQQGCVYPDALQRKERNAEPCIRNRAKEMHCIRVGRVPKGGKMPAGQKEINKCLEPPPVTRKFHDAKVQLREATRQLLFEYQMDMQQLENARAVRDWLLMKEDDVPPPTSTTASSPGPTVQPNGRQQHPKGYRQQLCPCQAGHCGVCCGMAGNMDNEAEGDADEAHLSRDDEEYDALPRPRPQCLLRHRAPYDDPHWKPGRIYSPIRLPGFPDHVVEAYMRANGYATEWEQMAKEAKEEKNQCPDGQIERESRSSNNFSTRGGAKLDAAHGVEGAFSASQSSITPPGQSQPTRRKRNRNYKHSLLADRGLVMSLAASLLIEVW